jgi:predicted amidohydrolase
MSEPMVRVGVVQMRVRTGRVEDNLERAEAFVRDARARGCRLVVLPEAFATGLDLPRSRERATPIPGPRLEWLARLAAAEGVYLAAGLLEAHEGAVYSTAVLLDDGGRLLHLYRRANVYDLEAYFLASGGAGYVVDTPLGRIGMIVGYDVQFPETLRLLFAQSAEIVVCPALLLRPFAESIRQMVRARPAENCCYFLFASATGENTLAGLTYLGDSAILQSPIGLRPYSSEFRRQEPVLAEAGREEALLTADLDLEQLRRLQAANPLLKDFRRSPFCRLVHVLAEEGA